LEAVSADARANGVSMVAFGTIASNEAMQALARDAGFGVSALVFVRDAADSPEVAE
jgi:1-aminocyclopropane-1-carboxylate deaminase/D-cysteine desulfhydrase-like pyridoxal-dependent ACC family enzyme